MYCLLGSVRILAHSVVTFWQFSHDNFATFYFSVSTVGYKQESNTTIQPRVTSLEQLSVAEFSGE